MTDGRGKAGLSLTARVLGTVLVILLVGGLLVAGSIWWNTRAAARQSYDRILFGAASDIAAAIRIQQGTPLVDLPVSAFELLAQAPDDRVYYAVTGPGGALITALDPAHTVPAPDQPASVGATFFTGTLSGEEARFVRLSRSFAERDFSGAVEVVVGQTLRARNAMTTDLMLDALLPMAAAGLLLTLLAALVVRSALRPLDALVADLSRRDPYDLTPMPAEALPRELGVMLGAVNRFMGRLDGQVEAMRTLISDTAHQLRTPVAAIQVHGESAAEEQSEEARERALARLLARTRSLRTLLDQLLSRALVVHRTDSAPRTPVDLREVALEVMERDDQSVLRPEAELRLQIGDAPVMVRADAFSLQEAAHNLLNNALRHGQAPVSIGAEQRGREAVLWVEDSGPGPAPEVIAHLGERFNRSADSREQGSGVGLSIVAKVASAFGGRVEMGASETGFRAALVLPAEEAHP
ncbi:sensor histidine kinase [Vannielia litorea]|uniref:sensor histidine kinase n=1 Tax=Vannielia litorea TaxID=1217970 RepID=UPI001C9570A9|nr:sensor histidine kinase [Vannielia litorea]MBY6046741.1 sensor histidine kinase [Vannielia litorea]MBY6074155.1 sensor histidine kinase [Vannielia litorea]